jgi:transcriptional regulator with XRE-family HTH domain
MTDPISSAWESQRESMGALIRSQRELANMSLRELSRITHVSNAYLSQIERGRNDPTLRVLLQIGDALELSVEEMLRHGAGRTTPDPEGERPGSVGVEAAIRADPRLTDAEKQALTAVYRSYVRSHARDTGREGTDAED